MADSVDPRRIPAAFGAYNNRGVAPYANGLYTWSRRQVGWWPRHVQGIDVNGQAPELADVLDSERFDATPQQWPAWRTARVRLVHENKARGWPKVYCSINPGGGYGVKPIVEATKAAGQIPVERWWIAWYVYPRIPTAAEVAAEILRLTGEIVDPDTIWGCQYGSLGAYDVSVVYQAPEWQ